MSDLHPHYFGRGRLHFCAPLTDDGLVDQAAAAGWGSNWPNVLATGPAAPLRMPPGRFLGNVRSYSLQPLTRELNVPEWDDDSAVVDGVAGSITMLAQGARSLADAMRAVVRQSPGVQRTETFYTSGAAVPAEAILPTTEVIDVRQAVQILPSWPEARWVEGVHWERDPTGVRLLRGFAGPEGSTVEVKYFSEGEAFWLEAFERPRVTVGLIYAGVNRHDMTPVRVDGYRARISPGEDFQVISEATGEVRISFRLAGIQPAGWTRPRWYRRMHGRASHG